MRFLWMLLLAGPVFGCSCVSTGYCGGAGSEKRPQFVGTVLSVSRVAQSGDKSRKARIRVIERYGGVAEGLQEVDVFTGLWDGDCGYPFEPGRSYLIDAGRDNGDLVTSTCSGTKPVVDADVSLGLLRRIRDGRRTPAVIGQVKKFERNFSGSMDRWTELPLSGQLVRLKDRGQVFSARSDLFGVFAFYDLPAGTYQVDAVVPPGLKIAAYAGGERPLEEVAFDGKRCRLAEVVVGPRGSIQGRVVDSGGRLQKDGRVYIVPASVRKLPPQEQMEWTRADKNGVYSILHLADGEYVVMGDPRDLGRGRLVQVRGGAAVQGVDVVVR